MKKKTKKTIWAYVILVVFGFIMVYPLIWMFFATFKDNRKRPQRDKAAEAEILISRGLYR